MASQRSRRMRRSSTVWAALAVAFNFASAARAAAAPDPEVMRLRGHTGVTLGVAFSPDGTRIATGASDRVAILWDASRGTTVRRLEGHASAVSDVAFSGDGARLVTGSIDQTARVWDVGAGVLIAQLNAGHRSHVHAVAISPDGSRVLTGSCDGAAVLWDVAAEKAIGRFEQANEVWAVGFAPDGKSFFVGNQGDRGRTGACLRLYTGDGTTSPPTEYQLPPVRGAAFVDGGKALLVNAGSALWRVDIATGKMREAKRPGTGGPSMTAWGLAPDGRTCLMADMQATSWVDAETARPLAAFPAEFTEQVRAVAISPDGKLGVIGGGGMGPPWSDGFKPPTETDVRVVRLVRSPEAVAGTAPRGVVRPTAPPIKRTSPDGKRTLTIDTVRMVWTDAASGTELGRVARPRQESYPAVAPDVGRVVFWDRAGQVLLAEPGAPAVRPLFQADGFDVGSVRFAHDGASLWVASLGPVDAAQRADALKRRARTVRPGGTPSADAPKTAPPDGKLYGVYRWDLSAGRWAGADDAVKSPVRFFQTTPDNRVALCITDGLPEVLPAVHAWDADTDKPLWSAAIDGSDPRWVGRRWAGYHRLIMHPDNATGVWMFGDVAGVFGVRTGKTAVRLERQKGIISDLAIDPDGKRVWIIASRDAIRAYDLKSGAVLRTVSLNGLGATDGRLVLTSERRVANLVGDLGRREERDLGN